MNALMKPHLSPLRVGRITGSRVSAILGANPYQSRADVLRAMVREYHGAEPEFVGNEATRFGELHEPDALALYEAQNDCMTYGAELVIHPQHDFLAVTPDGLVGEDGMVECKAPYRAKYRTFHEAPYYVPQMRLQMECCRRKWCDFVVWHEGEIYVSRLAHDPEWLPSVLPKLVEFHADYRAAIESPEPHLASRVIERGDVEWIAAVRNWKACMDALNEAKEREARARAILIDEADGCTTAGAGITCQRSERKGNINYSKVPELAGVDLEPYRGKSSVVWTIRTDKEPT